MDKYAPDTTEFQEKRRRLDVDSLDIPELIKSVQDVPTCKAIIAAATLRIQELESESYHKQHSLWDDKSSKKPVNYNSTLVVLVNTAAGSGLAWSNQVLSK